MPPNLIKMLSKSHKINKNRQQTYKNYQILIIENCTLLLFGGEDFVDVVNINYSWCHLLRL